MYLKSLELHGFKSFGKKSGLNFNTPITSIVGPNGSGKSNVAEAFRFVLGEQSLKSMRGKKGEDMIWNGNTEVSRANRASVKITFDNSRRFLSVDFDEVSIERTVYRDGVNEYSINGTKVRLKDVLELLASAHIGSSGHHIISQGEADRILNSNIKERKAMIEDALGLKIYQYKMDESEKKLTKTEENIKSVESLRREVAPHLKFLKKQVEKVEKAALMKAELATLYKQYLKRENKYLLDLRTKITEEQIPVDKLLTQLEQDLSEAKAILARSQTHDQKSNKIVLLEEKMRRTRERKDECVREIGRVEGQIVAEERIFKKENEVLNSAEVLVPISDVEKLAGELSEQITFVENESDPTVLKRVFEVVRVLVLGFVSAHKQRSRDVRTFDSEKVLSELKTKRTDLDIKLSEVGVGENSLSKEYGTLRAEIDAEKDTNRAAEKKLFEVMSAQNNVIVKKNGIRAREEVLKIEEQEYKRELGEAAVLIGREILDFEHVALEGDENEERSTQHERRRNVEKIKIRLEESGVGATEEIMKEFCDVSERDAFLVRELDDLRRSAESLKVLIKDFGEKISTEFALGLEKINRQFEQFFSLMFGGGEAKLVHLKEKKRRSVDIDLGLGLEMSEDDVEIEEGIDISVNLPKKKIKGLMMLSGGERALTSIALIFAMSQVKPPPFIILDETDAALDESNSKKYGDMIESLAKYSQLILITHNRETMARAGVLYGVTMMTGVSKLLSIQFEEAVSVAK